MKNAPVVDDDDFGGILVMDEEEFLLQELIAAIPEKKFKVTPDPVSEPKVIERRAEVPPPPVSLSAQESATMIEEWLQQHRPEKKPGKTKPPAPVEPPVAKQSETVTAKPIEEKPQTSKPKKEERKAKPPTPPKKEKTKKVDPVVDASTDEEELEFDEPEAVEEIELEEGDVSAVPKLVNGQWKMGYDVEAAFYREISRHELLTVDEERELLRRYLENKDRYAWDKLVACNLRLVAKYARYYMHTYHVPFLDAVQEGNIGLMHAIRRYSFEKECKLSTYATWWIKQAITRWIMDNNRTIRLPVHVHELLSKSRKVSIKLFKQLGREPSQEEVAKELGVTLRRLKNAEEGLKKILSTDCALKADEADGDLLGDFIPDDRPLQDEQMHDQELSDNVIGPALLTLKPQRRFVMVMRFGLTGFVFTEKDIAEAMKLEVKKVRELEHIVLQKLNIPDEILFDRGAAMEWLRHVSRKALTPQEELVFILRYGIGAVESTLEGIAERVSVTRERIRQIEEKSLPILRKRMEQGTLKSEKKMGIHKAVGAEAVSAAEARKGVY